MAESFMRTLKREEVNGQAYRDRAEAEASIEAFIGTVLDRTPPLRHEYYAHSDSASGNG
jgi:hypothetical protein